MVALNQGCDCANEVSAEFLMEESGGASSVYSDISHVSTITDTIYANKDVWFTATEDNADYTWYIGSEIIHEKQFYRHFPASLAGQVLPMILVVKKKTNKICFPNDDGYDSIVKQLVVTDPFNNFNFFNTYQWKWEGIYRMSDSIGVDSIDVKMRLGQATNSLGGVLFDRYIITNFLGDGDSLSFGKGAHNYRQYFLKGNGCYLNPGSTGFIHYKLDGTYHLSLRTESINCMNVDLFGRKLN